MRKDNGVIGAIAATALLAVAGLSKTRALKGSQASTQRTAEGVEFVTERQLSNIYHDEDDDGWLNLSEFVSGIDNVFYYVPSDNESKAISIIAKYGYEPVITLDKGREDIRTYGGFGSRPISAIKIDKSKILMVMLSNGTKIIPMLNPDTMLHRLVELIYHDGDKKFAMADYVEPLINGFESISDQDFDERDIEKAFIYKDGKPEDVIEYMVENRKLNKSALSRIGKDMISSRRSER